MILIAPAPPQHTPATSLRDAADVCLAVAVAKVLQYFRRDSDEIRL